MNPPSALAGSERTDKQAWLWALLAFIVCLLAISRQSLWIDETLTAIKASQASLSGWWQAMLADKASDLQMPLYMIYMWGFAKIFGTSEWALRTANIPWFVAGVAAFISSLPGARKTTMAIIALTSCFAWYYLDEARPYAMQLGASLLIVAALSKLSQKINAPQRSEGVWAAIFCLGIVALSGSSLLGMIWAGAACLALFALFSLQRLTQLLRAHLIVILISVCVLLALTAYYLWTLKLGARASDVGRTDARNVVFITYELLGFGGLGPGRLEIRGSGFSAFAQFGFVLTLYGMVVSEMVLFGLMRIFQRNPRALVLKLAIVIALPALMILGAGVLQHFRVLGRHFMPLLPVVWLVLWHGMDACWSRRNWFSRTSVSAFVVLSLASCLSLRFASRHLRDDYRGAASIANGALRAGKTVWWNAAREGAVYYQVPLADDSHTAGAILLLNPGTQSLAALPAPDMVVASKPDVFDVRGACAEYAHGHGFTVATNLPAFTICRRE